MTRARIFVSYAHEDHQWVHRLKKHLNVLVKQKIAEVWLDDRIQVGANWREEILQAIDNSHVAVLLVSAQFLGSEFIMDTEIPRLLERRRLGELKLVPVLIEPCAWRAVHWLTEVQIRPWNTVALSGSRGYKVDSHLTEITEEIFGFVQKHLAASSVSSTGAGTLTEIGTART
jgi:hypothetical protein